MLVGRIEEQKILAGRIASGESELIAVYGRRRVGKTFLIRSYFKERIIFEVTGIHGASLREQLQNFGLALQTAMKSNVPIATPANWIQAFHIMDQYLNGLPKSKPAVLFFDEFPWFHTQKSGFLQAFEHWWNSSASKKDHLKVIICGSAASWMIDQVINNKGGLHNRVTQTIRLLPFTLAETEQYLLGRGIRLSKYLILQLYMAIGGIPHYLKGIQKGESVVQAIDRLCFTKDGFLKGEFKNLYQSLFNDSHHHEEVIRALAKNAKGLSRNEIIDECGFSSGGSTTKILNELEESGFITPYVPFGKNEKESIYKLSDEYSLFYLKFIEHALATGAGTWLRQSTTASYTSWSGFAFESVCQKHVLQIKKALGIEGVFTKASSWRYKPAKGKKGAQIDLLLDRQDKVINLCEMKFTNGEFVIDKKYAEELENKKAVFRSETKTRSTIFSTMITTYGVKKNDYYRDIVDGEVLAEDLFK
ncbi:AAA family ATPase [Chitinophaga filiformis]|uniref:AAA family ATPase n=1 Tax=Chitinophaga filiformis TaxID=104663 RepID=UPI001F3FF0AB|nr:ATP-binding protein [Chitinophaga filiformis]MCF6402259.1 AAA family ATPase [Chitinophaga filiformis]